MNLNISGIPENNSINLSGNQMGQIQSESGVVIKDVPKTDAGLSMLLEMNPGETFQGLITDVNQNQITLLLNNNSSVTATLADALSFNIGDTASFSIKDNSGDKIILKSINSENLSNLANDQTIQNAIRGAGMAVNDQTVSLVHNLMKQGLPIDSTSLNEFVKIWNNAPNATAEDIALMTKMQLPVTTDNISALHDYYNFSDGISSKMTELSESISNVLSQSANDSPAVSADILNKFVTSFLDTISNEEMINETIDSKSLSNLSDMVRLLAPDLIFNEGVNDNDMLNMQQKINEEVNELSDKISNGNTTAREILSDLSKMISENIIDKDALNTFFESDDFKKITDNLMRQEFFLKSEDLSKNNIKKLMAKISTDADSIASKLMNNSSASEIVDNLVSVKQNVSFMNDMNQFMSFIQIPIKMSGQNAHGDLYVCKGKKSKNEDKDELSAFLHLDMDNLGPLDVLVKLKDKNVSTNFKVKDDTVLDFIEEHMDILNERLMKLGYNVSTTVSVNDKSYDFKKDVIENEFPPVDIKRFSFDVRA